MCNFIEDYPYDPAQAIMNAKALADKKFENIVIDEDMIWQELGKSTKIISFDSLISSLFTTFVDNFFECPN